MRALSAVIPGKDISPAFPGFNTICACVVWSAISQFESLYVGSVFGSKDEVCSPTIPTASRYITCDDTPVTGNTPAAATIVDI